MLHFAYNLTQTSNVYVYWFGITITNVFVGSSVAQTSVHALCFYSLVGLTGPDSLWYVLDLIVTSSNPNSRRQCPWIIYIYTCIYICKKTSKHINNVKNNGIAYASDTFVIPILELFKNMFTRIVTYIVFHLFDIVYASDTF